MSLPGRAGGFRTIGTEIAARIDAGSGDATAIFASGKRPLSYFDLFEDISRLQRALADANLPTGARIGVSIADAPRAAIGIIGAASSSATAAPFDSRLTVFETEARVDRLKLDAVLLAAGDDTPLRQVAMRRGIAVVDAVPISDDTLATQYQCDRSVRPSTLAAGAVIDAAVILPSSGTTADSKLIPCSHDNIIATAERVRGWYSLGPTDRSLCVSAVYYSHGLILTVLGALLSGGSVAFPRNPSQPDLKEWFCDLDPTWFSAGPALHLALSERIHAQGMPVPTSLRFAVSGGAPLPADIFTELQARLGVPLLEHYGMTEASQVVSNIPRPGLSKPGTCGKPDPTILRLAPVEDPNWPPGWGEVLVRGPSLTAGYLDAPDINRESFTDGWFHTGDIGSLDQDGFLVLHGRSKEIINRGGEKISPAEVDAALLRHPAILEAAAVAVPHPRLGQDVAAFAVLRPGASVSVEELRKYLATQLAWFKIPRRVTFVETLPRGSTGKVQRGRLVGEIQ